MALQRDIPSQQTSRKNYRLPVIIPCVLYNGAAEWTACRRFGEYQDGFLTFQDYALDFCYFLIDINRYNEEELIQLSNVIGAAFFMEKKGAADGIGDLKQLTGILKNEDRSSVNVFLTWLTKVLAKGASEATQHELEALIQGEQEVEVMISNLTKTVEEYHKRGIKIGLEQGREQGLARGVTLSRKRIAKNLLQVGLGAEQVAKATDLTLAEVLDIQNEQD